MLLAFVFIGCSHFFISDNKPKTIQENPNQTLQEQKETQSVNKIKGFNNITQGVIKDLCSKGDNIIVLRRNNMEIDPQTENEMANNLVFYNLKEEQIQNITSSSLKLPLAQFDIDEEGVYYLENKEESIFQLYWFDISNNKKVKISSADHQVTPNFYVSSTNKIYYGTKDGKIIQANKNNILVTIDIGSEYSIQQVSYYEDKNLLLISALEDEVLNLYSLDPKNQNLTKIIENIHGYFNISNKKNKILYSTSIPDSNKTTLCLYDLEDRKNIELLEGYPQKSIFSPRENIIAYLDRSSSNSDLQNIWILNLKTNKKEQIASNLKITSELFWHPRENKLFFSVCETKDNQLQSSVYSLDFKN